MGGFGGSLYAVMSLEVEIPIVWLRDSRINNGARLAVAILGHGLTCGWEELDVMTPPDDKGC